MGKTESKSELLNRLFKENGLLSEDWHEHKHYRIITRSGIEKIQYQNNVTVRFESVTMTPGFCVVKAQAIKPTTDGQFIEVQTFGSAGHNANGEADKGKQYQYLYYPEMAEKRALSRAVLKICNFYELGVFGEDEADDFKAKEPVSQKANNDKTRKELAQTAYVEPIIADAEQPVTIDQKTEILLLLNNSAISKEKKEKTIEALNNGYYNAQTVVGAIAKIKEIIKKAQEGNLAA